jgi:hypothetical protein
MNLSHKASARIGEIPATPIARAAPILTSSRCQDAGVQESVRSCELMILHNQGSPTLMKADHVTYSF